LNLSNFSSTIFSISREKVYEILTTLSLTKNIYKISEDNKVLIDVVNRISKLLSQREKFKHLFKSYKLKRYDFDNIRVFSNKAVNEIEFSFCCHPKRGDNIVGFLDSKNRKVIIHNKLCSTATELIKDEIEMVYVEWIREDTILKYRVVVALQNRKGELAKFLSDLAKMDVSIDSIELGVNSDLCTLDIEIKDKKIENVLSKLKQAYNIIEFVSKKDKIIEIYYKKDINDRKCTKRDKKRL